MRISDWSSDVCSSDLFFDGVTDMNAAENFRNLEVYVYENELWDLEPGHYYNFQLVGLDVYDSETGAIVGIVKSMRPGVQNYLNEIGRASCRERGCQYV